MASFSDVSNIASANAQSNLQGTNLNLNKALTRLSSGFRINNAGDDAAGLAVANTYRNTQAILSQGIRNANDGMSKLQIKDGALNNISTLLDRLATLATQAGSASNGVDISKLSDADWVASVARRSSSVEMLLSAPSLICSVDSPSFALRMPWFSTATFDRNVFATARPAASSPELLMRRPLDRRVSAVCRLPCVARRFDCAFAAEILLTTENEAI